MTYGLLQAVTTSALLAATALTGCGGGDDTRPASRDKVPQFAHLLNSGSSNTSSFTVDAPAGALAVAASPAAIEQGGEFIAIHPSGKFAYATSRASGNVLVYAIDARTGVMTVTGARVSPGTVPRSMVVDPSGNFAYDVSSGVTPIAMIIIAPAASVADPLAAYVEDSGATDRPPSNRRGR